MFGPFPYYALQVISTFYSFSSAVCARIYTNRRLASRIYFSLGYEIVAKLVNNHRLLWNSKNRFHVNNSLPH